MRYCKYFEDNSCTDTQLTNQNCETRLRQIYSEIIRLCYIDSAWTCEWEWNNVERFSHLDWLEQKLMESLPVVTNASF